MGITLRVCPLCGGKAYATRTVNGTQMFHVGCASCGLELKAAWYRDEEQPTKDILALWNTRVSAEVERQREEIAALRTERDSPVWVEQRLRQEWWAGHGCSVAALYGDDGEMQCNASACMKDFKRDSMESLRAHVESRRLQLGAPSPVQASSPTEAA